MSKTTETNSSIVSETSQDVVIFSPTVADKAKSKKSSVSPEILNSTNIDSQTTSLRSTNVEAEEADIDPITLAIREQILIRQLNSIKNTVADISPESQKQKISGMNTTQFKQYIENPENKDTLDNALKNETLQKELHKIEVEGYKAVHTQFQDRFKNIKWTPEPDNTVSRTNEVIGPGGDVYCKLTETTHKQSNVSVSLSDGSQKTINSYRTIDFPKELDNKGPMHLSMAVKDADGKNIAANKALFFTAHYDESGKLTEVSSPQPVKFAGTGDDAVGYVEKDGQIYTLSVTQGKYKEMMQEVAKNNGMGFDISEQTQVAAQDKIVTKSTSKGTEKTKSKPDVTKSSSINSSQIESEPVQKKSNYEVLQDNKNATLEFASKFASSKPVPVLPEKGLQNKLKNAKTSVENGDFETAIKLLDELKDNRIGIVWHESGDLGHGTKAVVRDARNVTADPDVLAAERGEKYGMQVLNEIRTAFTLIDNEGGTLEQREEAKKKLMYVAQKSLNEIDTLNQDSVKDYNTIIVDTLQKAGVGPDSEQKLLFGMQLASFQDEHKHVVTLSNAKDGDGVNHTVIEADVMLNGTTPKLKRQFEAISQNNTKILDSPEMDWYTNLPEYKQKLIAGISDKMASGQYVMPTQLLGTMPGVRNAYDKVTAVQSPGKEKPVIVNENLHCGAPASKAKGASKEGRQEIANMNVELLQSFSKDGRVNLNTFNSGILGMKNVNEGFIFEQLKASAKGNPSNVDFTASPLNAWRKVPGGGRDHKHFKQNLKDIGAEIQSDKSLKNASKFLRKGGSKSRMKKALAEINKLEDKDYAHTLKIALEARQLIDTPARKEKGGNINLAVTNKVSYLENLLNNPENKLHGVTDIKTRVDFCKSGKDRTGYGQTKNTHHAVSQHLGISENPELMSANLLSQVAGGHTQEMAGIQGGTVGCHSIKHSAVFFHTKEDKVIDNIHNQKSANYNSKIRMGKKKGRGAVARDFETEYSQNKQKSSGIKSNYEKLQENKNATLKFATNVAKSDKASIENRNEMLLEARGSLAKGDFEKAILKMDQLKDAKLGIVWHESSDLGNGTKALVRDARNLDNIDPELFRQDAGEKYAMQILNEVRGGIALLDSDASNLTPDQKEAAKAKLKEIAEYALDQIDFTSVSSELNSSTVKEFNTAIIDTLEQAGIEDPGKKLTFAKEISNFNDDHRHIVTLTTATDRNGEKHTVMEAEVMLNGLTEKQTKMYQAIANSERGAKIDGNDMAWYNDMPKYKREMLHDVAGDIATGNKVIPTQLLGDVVGVRNAYQKVTAIKEGDHATILAENLHCGAPATKIKLKNSNLSKDEVKAHKEQIVNDNIQQLQSFVEPGTKLNLNNLTSKTPANMRGENFIHKQVNKSKSANVSVTASPINRWRKLGAGRKQKEFDNTLKNIGNDLEGREEFQDISKYLQKGNSKGSSFFSKLTFGAVKTNHDKAMASIERLSKKDPKLAGVLKEAITVKKHLHKGTNASKSENINLDISAKMNVVDNAIRQPSGALNAIASKKTKKEHAVRVDFCKSGKDRTGLVEMENTHEVVSNHLGVDPSSEQGKRNKLSQVKGGHTQEMAGVQGGSIGCHSVKTNPEFALNKSDKAINGIINQKSSKFNSSVKVVKEKKKAKTLEKFRTGQKLNKAKKTQIDSVRRKSTNVVKSTGAKTTPKPTLSVVKKAEKGGQMTR